MICDKIKYLIIDEFTRISGSYFLSYNLYYVKYKNSDPLFGDLSDFSQSLSGMNNQRSNS